MPMKYNFEKTPDRKNDPYSYSSKYGVVKNPERAKGFGFKDGSVPEDTLVFFLADMDFECAPPIIEACKKAADHKNFGYSAPDEKYYSAVRRWFKDHFDWEFAADDIYYCHGTHPGVAEALSLYTKPGSGCIVMCPSYNYHGDIDANDRKFVPVQFKEENTRFSVDWEAFEKACADPENEAFVIIQPHNPLGIIFTVEEMQRMADICRRNNVLMISDEVHIDIVRKGKTAVPFMKAVGPQGVVSLTGLAKTFNIAGLSMSNMIVCDPVLKEKLAGRHAGASPFGIAATTAAYTQCDDWVAEMNEYIDSLVAYVEDFIDNNMTKLKVTHPDASYVVMLDFRGYGLTSDELDDRIAGKAHILIGNGKGFDGVDGDQWRRMCLTNPMSEVKEAMERLKEAFKDLEQ